MTPEEFATKIKAKYPQYKGVDDATLVDRIITKYPQYRDQVSGFETQEVGDEGSTVTEFGRGVGKAAAETVKGIGELGRAFQKKISQGAERIGLGDVFQTGPEGIFDPGSEASQRAEEFLAPETAAEAVGKFTGEVGQFAVPGAAASKATRGASLARRAASEGATAAGVQTAQTGEADAGTVAAGIGGGAIPVAGAVAKPVIDYGKGVLKGLAGQITGVGEDVIERAFVSPTAAREGMKAGDEEALKKVSKAVRQGVKDLKKKASKEYEELTSSVKGQLDGKQLKQNIDNFFVENADATPTKEGLRFADTPLMNAEEEQLEKVYRTVHKWSDFSPQGINKLATKISRFRRGTDESQNFDLIIDNLRRNVRSFVGDQVPEIAEANAKFATKMDLIDELDSILKTAGPTESRQGIRETSQRIARLFNANKELSREAVDELEGEIGIDALAMEAGRQLSDTASRFQIGAQDTAMALVRTLIPRSMIGNIVTRTGQSTQAVEKILGENLSRLDPAARGVFVETLGDMFSEE